MSELKPGDIRLDCGQVYLVISDGKLGGKLLRVWLHNNTVGGLSLSGFDPEVENPLMCNIQQIFKDISDNASKGKYD